MKIILSGVSAFSERWVAAAFAAEGVTVDALVNRTPEKFQAVCRKHSFPMERCFPTLSEALKASQAEAVVVTIPTRYHHAQVKEALKAGRHVLVEKPLALTLKEGRELVDLAKKKKRLLSIVSQHRFAPYLQVFKRYCTTGGSLGRPLSFFVRIHMNRPETYYTEAPARCTGPGVLAIQGAHALDWIHWWFGKAGRCTAAMGTLFHKTHNEDNGYAAFTMKNGVMGLFDINHMTRGKNELTIKVYFEKGTLEYDQTGRILEVSGNSEHEITYEKVNPQFDSLKAQLLNFADAVEGKGPLEVTAQDGLNVMVLLDAIYKSGRKIPKVRYPD